MGTFTTPPPAAVYGPETGTGFDIRNTDDPGQKLTNLTAFKADVDRVVANGGQWVRMGISANQLADFDVNNPDTGGTNGDGWSWWPDTQALLLDQLKYVQSKGLKVSFTPAPHPFSGFSDQQWQDWNDRAYRYLAKTYGPYATIWQVFNEDNKHHVRQSGDFGGEPVYDDVYREFFRASHKRFADTSRAEAPHLLVTSAMYGFPPDKWLPHWKYYYDAIAPHCDIIGLNCYTAMWEPAIDTVPAMIREMQQRYGKPVAITETGFTNYAGTGGDQAAKDAEITRLMPYLLDMWRGIPDVLCAIVYSIRDMTLNDPGTGDLGEWRFGLYYGNGTAKPYQAATAQHTAAQQHRSGARWGDYLTLAAGASTDTSTVTWRVIGGNSPTGNGRLLNTTGRVATYIPAGSPTGGYVDLGCAVDGVERTITVQLARHPEFVYSGGVWRPTLTNWHVPTR